MIYLLWLLASGAARTIASAPPTPPPPTPTPTPLPPACGNACLGMTCEALLGLLLCHELELFLSCDCYGCCSAAPAAPPLRPLAPVSTLAGSGAVGSADGAGAAASFKFPHGVAASPDGSTVYVTDPNNKKVRAINVTSGEVSTLAGSGASGSDDGAGAAASFDRPYGVAASPDGRTVYVVDSYIHNSKVRAINVASGEVSTLAGSGAPHGGSADGAGADASFNSPQGVAVSPDGSTVYVADRNNNKVRAINVATGYVSTLAGSGSSDWFAGGDGAGADASFSHPLDVAVSPSVCAVA